MIQLGRITLFPIKSLDGLSVPYSKVLPSGALAWDRRFALVDIEGKFWTGKRTAKMHAIAAEFNLSECSVTLSRRDKKNEPAQTFTLCEENHELENWFSEQLGGTCRLIENVTQGFPDDMEAMGPTLVSTATLEEVTRWFEGMTLDDARARFRANLEIAAPEPFWEDRLVGKATNRPVRFSIGEASFFGCKPCQRCVVPTRHSTTGDIWPRFVQQFSAKREEALSSNAPKIRFDHYYRLAVNTSTAATGPTARLNVGDVLEC